MKKLLLIMNPCSGTKKAHHVLADIINILHPGLLKDHRNRFFTPLP